MSSKHVICPERIRKIPKQFSRADHRLVRNQHIDRLSHAAASLYLFLITVADHQGLSYYSDASIGKRLSMDAHTLATARGNLIQTGLIAWQKPLYQVLDMDAPDAREIRINHIHFPEIGAHNSQPQLLGDVLKRVMGRHGS